MATVRQFNTILKQPRLILCLLSIIMMVTIQPSIVLAGVGQELLELQCRGQDLNMTPEQKGHVQACLTQVGVSSLWQLPSEKLACFGICVYEKKNFLTPERKVAKETMLSYFDVIMRPEEVKEPMKLKAAKCIDDHGAKVKPKSEDPSCMSFLELGRCVHEGFVDLCIEDGAGDETKKSNMSSTPS